MRDTLPADSVPLPQGVVGPSEESDEVAADKKVPGRKGPAPSLWNELGTFVPTH